MATPIILPQQGNSVESCLLTAWKVAPGDRVTAGTVVAEVETDKALFTVEAPADGTLLEQFYAVGDEVPVMTAIAAVGQPGEDVGALRPASPAPAATPPSQPQPRPANPAPSQAGHNNGDDVFISPRALALAERKGVSYDSLRGTGPEGRIIERDVQAALAGQNQPLTRLASIQQPTNRPASGSGLGGRVTTYDLTRTQADAETVAPDDDVLERIPLRGIRKVIAERMHASLRDSAQLTLNAPADARALLAYRQRLKASDEALGLAGVSVNDLLLFAVARTLPRFPALNATVNADEIVRYRPVHLGFAVDTPRGLVVPVIANAHAHPLAALSAEAKRLAAAVANGKIMPEDLSGGTFTVTNLGALGVESFTPIINPPQVAILGVGGVHLKPVEVNGTVEHYPHLALSLTIDHRAIDGAPAARFLQALTAALADFDLLLAT